MMTSFVDKSEYNINSNIFEKIINYKYDFISFKVFKEINISDKCRFDIILVKNNFEYRTKTIFEKIKNSFIELQKCNNFDYSIYGITKSIDKNDDGSSSVSENIITSTDSDYKTFELASIIVFSVEISKNNFSQLFLNGIIPDLLYVFDEYNNFNYKMSKIDIPDNDISDILRDIKIDVTDLNNVGKTIKYCFTKRLINSEYLVSFYYPIHN
jgi:hypothetical protein